MASSEVPVIGRENRLYILNVTDELTDDNSSSYE